ncbi:protein transport protein sft2 [Coemansia aciculifera]|uniref:Protein transport protein SFT2 n=2 Tax=Coemansia TaxID=4863 RepID=A0A9W8GWB1_9FUNG|nr:protein transport protein sft2 [Coemansia sp. S146]KAJ2749541.1 protein transport protein sft2 [Coemansia pectinata]KAJ2860847.1 protein transport protein sft2 [Coemansia aciculifera]KAJ2870967.1 protein transport protein sft2 [Coemansia aciculifera]KAJ2886983.1 protein transport protein sft2 [Coemansia aciculifera]
MSSFRDALSGLKTSSTPNYTPLPSTQAEASGSGGGFFGNLREGASSFVSNTGNTLSGLTGFGNDDSTGTVNTSNRGEWFGLTLMQRWVGFAGCAVLALFCYMLAFMALPLMIVSPQKFATAFSLGSLSTISGIALLRGPRAHTQHMVSRERLVFTLTYFGSVFFTLFFSAIAHSYLGTLFFVIIQIIALVWYVVSYFPGGSAGLQSTTMNLAGGARTLLPF